MLSPSRTGTLFLSSPRPSKSWKGPKFSLNQPKKCFHMVRIRRWDEWKTAFNTPSGHYEYLGMPFALTNAPAVFQALVNYVFRDMLNLLILVYLHDILIFSPDKETHVHHVHQVLMKLLENQLFVQSEKCEFHIPSTTFWGFFKAEGEVPVNCKHVQGFLGFANFYRWFIRHFTAVAAPLHALIKPDALSHIYDPDSSSKALVPVRACVLHGGGGFLGDGREGASCPGKSADSWGL